MLKKKTIKKIRKFFRRIDVIAISSLVVAILSFIVAIKTDLFKKPVMSFNKEIPITFLLNNEYDGYYDLYLGKMQDNIETLEQLIITANIANPLANDIQLNKICINVSNIKKDNTPYFKIYPQFKDDGVYIRINNCGWGDAENINFIFKSDNDLLFDYIGKNAIDLHIDKISAGETIEYPFILNDDVTDIGVDSVINFSTYCKISDTDISKSIIDAYLSFDVYDGIFVPIGIGGGSNYVYGIKFDTDKSSFSYERSILEEINSGEIMVLPICIFPDQTCTFDLDVKFQYLYNGKEKYFSCKEKNIKVIVDYPYIDEFKKDISDMEQKDIQNAFYDHQAEIVVSYPAIRSPIAYPRCPLCDGILQGKMSLLNVLSGKNFTKLWYCENCNVWY